MSSPKFTVQTIIQKPIAEVFEAVYNPKKLSGYFTTAGASAPLDPGTTVYWDFKDFPGAFPVFVKEVERNKLITFEWEANDTPDQCYASASNSHAKYNTRVEMFFEIINPNETMVKITERGWKETPEANNSAFMNCQGWMNMSCCLKAYLEYGINLRDGFFKAKNNK